MAPIHAINDLNGDIIKWRELELMLDGPEESFPLLWASGLLSPVQNRSYKGNLSL
jgi:hypothetical protein